MHIVNNLSRINNQRSVNKWKLFNNGLCRKFWCEAKDENVEKVLMITVGYGGGSVMLWARFSWEPRQRLRDNACGIMINIQSTYKIMVNGRRRVLIAIPKKNHILV